MAASCRNESALSQNDNAFFVEKNPMKRKIALLSSAWRSDFATTSIRGIQRRLEQENIDLYIFNAYDMTDSMECYTQENMIYSLPDMDDYDGVLIAINTLGNREMVAGVIEKCHQTGKPVLSIESKYPGAAYIGVDNYRSMYGIVEHMIQEHHCRVFNYLGGPEDNIDDKQRFQGFCDALRDAGLEPDPERITHRTFRSYDGNKVYKEWKQLGIHTPDAVICANDDMAVGYCMAGLSDGVKAPVDYLITGFDNLHHAQYCYPSITSVNRNWETLGYEGADSLLRMMEGKQEAQDIEVPGVIRRNLSCGCGDGENDLQNAYWQLYNENKRMEAVQEAQRKVREFLGQCSEREAFRKQIPLICSQLQLKNLAVCISPAWGRGVKPDRGFEVISEDYWGVMCRKDGLVPKPWLDEKHSQAFLFSSMYCGTTTSGYCVVPYRDGVLDVTRHKTLMESVGQVVERILRKEELKQAKQKLEELYVQDPLTGLYNRFGYKAEGARFYSEHEGKVYLVYLDLNKLKAINDVYGHQMGDYAIAGMADCMRRVFNGPEVLVRLGGDEFLVVGAYEGEDKIFEKRKALERELIAYSKEKDFPMELHTSFGYSFSADGKTDIQELLQKADQMMYADKYEKRQREQLMK